jgi:hypothetical protein
MTAPAGCTSLYVQFEGARGARRPVCARARAPRSGIKVRVLVEDAAASMGQVFLLYRRGYGDMVLGGSVRRHLLEEARARLGSAAAEYVIQAVPVLHPALENPV